MYADLTLYQVLLAVVGAPPVGSGIGGIVAWILACILAVLLPLYGLFYVTRVFIDWGR